MTNQEQAFLNGFVKRAAEYGLDKEALFKSSAWANLVKRMGSMAAKMGPRAFPAGLEATQQGAAQARNTMAQNLRNIRNEASSSGKLPLAQLRRANQEFNTAMHGLLPPTNPLGMQEGVKIYNPLMARAANTDIDYVNRVQRNLQNTNRIPQAPAEPIAKKRGLLASLFGY